MGLLSKCALNLKISLCCYAWKVKKCTKFQNARAELLFCKLNLLFCYVLVAVAVVVFFFSKSLSVKSKFVEPKKRKISRKATLPLNSLRLLLENVHASGKPSDPEQNYAKELVHILRKFKVKN